MTNEKKKKLTTLTVDISYDLKDKLKFESYKSGKTIKNIVKESLEKYFQEINTKNEVD